jgi:hypothetical protein
MEASPTDSRIVSFCRLPVVAKPRHSGGLSAFLGRWWSYIATSNQRNTMSPQLVVRGQIRATIHAWISKEDHSVGDTGFSSALITRPANPPGPDCLQSEAGRVHGSFGTPRADCHRW